MKTKFILLLALLLLVLPVPLLFAQFGGGFPQDSDPCFIDVYDDYDVCMGCYDNEDYCNRIQDADPCNGDISSCTDYGIANSDMIACMSCHKSWAFCVDYATICAPPPEEPPPEEPPPEPEEELPPTEAPPEEEEGYTGPQWIPIAILAILTSTGILALLYAIGYGFGINELKFLVVEEFYQVFATILMIAIIFGTEGFLNEIASGLGENTLPDAAISIIDGRLSKQGTILSKLQSFSVKIGEESSKSSFCSLQSVGMAMNPCGSYRALSTPISMTYQMLGVAVAELSGLNTLAKFAKQYAFILLLPAGILLRTFRVTRGAGGLFIAFALSIYILMPLGVIAMKDVSDYALDKMEDNGIDIGYTANGGLPNLPSVDKCDEVSASESNYDRAAGIFNDLKDDTKAYIYEFLVNATLLTLVALSIMIAGLRVLASLAGAEVDVSALARLA